MSSYEGVHSCGPNCQEPLCVANRRIEELETKVGALAQAYNLRGIYIKDQDDRIEQLQAKVERLEEALDDKETPAAEVYELRKAVRIYNEVIKTLRTRIEELEDENKRLHTDLRIALSAQEAKGFNLSLKQEGE